MLEGLMNTTALCVSMYVEDDKGPNKEDLQAEFGLGATIWEALV